jgi:hypothetical protein
MSASILSGRHGSFSGNLGGSNSFCLARGRTTVITPKTRVKSIYDHDLTLSTSAAPPISDEQALDDDLFAIRLLPMTNDSVAMVVRFGFVFLWLSMASPTGLEQVLPACNDHNSKK